MKPTKDKMKEYNLTYYKKHCKEISVKRKKIYREQNPIIKKGERVDSTALMFNNILITDETECKCK